MFFVQLGAALALSNTTITGGMATNDGGAGIAALGALTIDHSTITGNTVIGSGLGAGIATLGAVSIRNSTISGNSVALSGAVGGIWITGAPGSTREFVNVTITDNRAGVVGGLGTNQAVTMRNTIVAANEAASHANCYYDGLLLGTGSIALAGTNLSNDATCGAAGANMIISADAKLGAIASNGGPTQTHALLLGSPAIDAATDCTVTDDQRYAARPQGSACDIGAYEFMDFVQVPVSFDPSATVNNKSGVALISGSIDCPAAGTTSLEISLSQAQKVGKINIVVQATATTTVSCVSGAAPWSAFLTPANGAFQNGAATATARVTSGLPPGYATTASPTAVKLFWSKG